MPDTEPIVPAGTPPPLPPGASTCGCAHGHSTRFPPLFRPLLHGRWTSLALGSLGAAQIGLTMLHVSAWPCPFFHLTGIPCPACGATRACAALLRGHWAESWRMHAGAPVFLGVITLLLVGGSLPDRFRIAFVAAIGWVERRTAAGYLFFVLLLLYWVVRLAIDPRGFIRLMKV